MVQVIRGTDSDLRAYLGRRLTELERALWLSCPPVTSAGDPSLSERSWNGARCLLEQAVPQLEPWLVEKIFARRRAAVSLVLDELDIPLKEEEQIERAQMAARLDSHLSHNWAIQRPLLEAWAKLLVELLAGSNFTIVVANLGLLDWETTAVLKTVYRLSPERAPDIIIGYEPDLATPERDAHGLSWGMESWYVQEAVLGFQMIPGSKSLDLQTMGDGSTEPSQKLALPGSKTRTGLGFEGLETRAFEALGSGVLPDRRTCALTVAAMRNCFHRFGFMTALRLGLLLLSRRPKLDTEQRAEVHGILALCAHNRQFKTAGNQVLADFLKHHLEMALAAEDRPLIRCAILYRLAVTCGRRKGQLEAAKQWADQGLCETREAGLSVIEATHQEGWARNIRAYILMRSKRVQEGLEDLKAALRQFDQTRLNEEPQGRWSREMTLTHSLLACNAAALSLSSEGHQGFRQWRQISSDIESAIAGTEKFQASGWIIYYRRRYRPDLALQAAIRGMKCALSENEATLSYRFTLQAADLCYRLGQAGQATQLFAQARNLRQRLGDPDFLIQAELSHAGALLRARQLEPARALLEEALTDPLWDAPEMRSQIHSTLGVVAADLDRDQEAEKRINRGIDLAVESGEHQVLLRTACAAGQVCQLLGRHQEAEEAFMYAVDLVDESGSPDSVSPADQLAALLGLHEARFNPADTQLARRCLGLLQEALRDSEAWWELPRLLRLVKAAFGTTAQVPIDLTKPLEILVAAAQLREDCRVPLHDLHEETRWPRRAAAA